MKSRMSYTRWEEWFLDGYTYTRCERGGIFYKFRKFSIVVRRGLAGRGILSPKKEKDELLIDIFAAIFVSSYGAIVADRHLPF